MLPFGTSILNVVTTTWTNRPSDPYGERRDGSGGIDDYADNANADLSIADVTMDKTGPITITAGSIITYLITIQNVGPPAPPVRRSSITCPSGDDALAATYNVPTMSSGDCTIAPYETGDRTCAVRWAQFQ